MLLKLIPLFKNHTDTNIAKYIKTINYKYKPWQNNSNTHLNWGELLFRCLHFNDLHFGKYAYISVTYLAPELLPVYSLSMNGPSSSEVVVVGTTTYLPLGRIIIPNTLLDLLYSDANTFSPTMCTLYFLFSST